MLTQTATEKLEQLQTQLTCLKEFPQPAKHADQQKLSKDCQPLQQQIENLQAFLKSRLASDRWQTIRSDRIVVFIPWWLT